MPSFDGFPGICFDNLFARSGTSVTDPSETTGYPATRLYDGLTFHAWKPDGLSATEDLIGDLGALVTAGGRMMFGLIGHNAYDESVTVQVAHSPNGIAWTTVFTHTPLDNRDVIYAWNQTTWARYWRARFSGIGSANLQVSELPIGQAVLLPDSLEFEGFDPKAPTRRDRMSRADESGEPVRAWITALQRNAGIRLSWVPVPMLKYDDPATGFDYWLENVADAGKPFLWHWAGSLQTEFRYDGFVAQLDGEVEEELASRIDDGRRHVTMKLTGADI